jgi:hypothetical protein
MMFKVFKVFITVRNKIYQTDYFKNALLLFGNKTINNGGLFKNIDGEEASGTTTLVVSGV